MKLSLAVALLCTTTSAYQLFDEDLTEDLDLTVSRYWSGRSSWEKSRRLDYAMRDLQRGPRREDMEDLNRMAKKHFGWTPMEKYEQIKPEERYWPLVQEIMKSKEFNEQREFTEDRIRHDPLLKKVMKEAEWLRNDIFGGYDSTRHERVRPAIEGWEINKRPSPEESKSMSRYEREKLEIEGVHIENNDIYDVAEDVEDLYRDFAKLMDLNDPTNQKAVRLDAQTRFSAPVQKLLKMVLNDFGIHDEKSFHDAMRALEEFGEDAIENCPYLPRARKAAERLIRYWAKAVKVGDLPTGTRKRWVNELTNGIYNAMKSDDPIPILYKFLDHAADNIGSAIYHHMKQVERMEQKYNKNGGI